MSGQEGRVNHCADLAPIPWEAAAREPRLSVGCPHDRSDRGNAPTVRVEGFPMRLALCEPCRERFESGRPVALSTGGEVRRSALPGGPVGR